MPKQAHSLTAVGATIAKAKSTPAEPILAVLLSTSGHSGVDRLMARLLPAIAARGISVHLLRVDAHGPYIEPGPGLEIHRLGTRHTSLALFGLVRYLRRYQPQVLLSDKDKVNRLALWGRVLARVPTRVAVRSGTNISAALRQRSRWERFSQRLSMRLFYRLADVIVTPSEGAADDLAVVARLPRSQISAIASPVVDSQLFAKASQAVEHPWFAEGHPPVILGVGELSGRKDFATLVRAFARVRHERACRLLIFGEGRERGLLLDLARSLGVAADVDLPGHIDNPYAYMARCAAFALTSTCEGSPIVLIEALACGARIVATDCPSGPRETLDNGRYGFLAPMGDDVAVAKGLTAALTTSEARPDASAVQRFTVEASVDAYLAALGLGPSRDDHPQ